MQTHNSEALFEEAKKVMPGGVNSPVRAFKAVGGIPRFIRRAKGSHLYDEDGNDYIDYVGSWGPAILGHANRSVIRAVQQVCEDGLTFGAPTMKEVILAKLITECMPSIEMVRLVNSGTEAVMSAIRLARGVTGRERIVKCRGCYHGHSDGLLVKAGSGALTGAIPDSEGIPKGYTENTLIVDYNDEQGVERVFSEQGDKIAAMIVEPVAANMGVILPKSGYLEFLRKITKKYGALLIFDEVITGFRLGLGGAQGRFGVQPDLTTLGKIIGGGMPMGAFGGRREFMEHVAPEGGVYQAGTLSGNPIATTAGIATITILLGNPGLYGEIENKAKVLKAAMKEHFGNMVQVNQIGSLLSMFFTEKPVTDYESARASDQKEYARFFSYLLENGIYIAPSQFEAMFLSNAHTEQEIERTATIIRRYPV